MTWFTASSVSVTNGSTVVSVNTGDDIQIAQEAGGLIIGTNPPVEIKRTYLDGSSNKKIELRSAWPYATQTTQPAVAFPTDGDLAAATAVLKQLIDGFAIATQVQMQEATNNVNPASALRVKQSIDYHRPIQSSLSDSTLGRLLLVGGGGILRGAAGIAETVDANTVSTTRFIQLSGSSTNLPLSGDGAMLFHFQWAGSDSAYQSFHRVDNTWQRFKWNGVWSNWVAVYHNSNIVGTVSQSGGVPTGAIIESGSNSNGYYTKDAAGNVDIIMTPSINTTLDSATTQNFTLPISIGTGLVSYCLTPKFLSATGSVNEDWARAINSCMISMQSTAIVGIIVTAQGSYTSDACTLHIKGRWY